MSEQRFKVGDRVAFSRTFLQSTSQFTGWTPAARGVVTELDRLSKDCVLAVIRWDNGAPGPVVSSVNVKNLRRVRDLHKEAV